MTEQVSLNLDFDYQNRKFLVSAKYPGDTIPTRSDSPNIINSNGPISSAEIANIVTNLPDGIVPTLTNIPFYIIGSDGTLLKDGAFSTGTSFASRVFTSKVEDFGINNQGNYGYDRSGNNTILFSSNPFATHRVSYSVNPSLLSSYPNLSGYISSYLESSDLPLSKVDGSYSGVPLQLTNGGACLNATVTAISNNRITWQNTSLVGSVSSVNFNNALVTSISGSLSGNSYRVLAYDNTNKYLWLDKSGSLTNNVIKVCPRVTATGYSMTTNNDSYLARFYINQSGVDELGYRTGNVVSSSDYDYTLGGSITLDCTQAVVSNDQYLRDPNFGDLLIYTNTAGNPATGMIISSSRTIAGTTMTYYPRNDVHPTSTFFTLKRAAKFNVEHFPKFSSNYSVVSFGNANSTFYGETNVSTPGATLEFAAGDYDSAFNNVVDTSHFHMGPITLTNGVVLTGSNIFISGQLFNNNPTSTVSLTSWKRWTSSDPNIASIHTGIYSKFGSLVGTYSQAFTTPDMLTLEMTASIGDVYVNRIINLPVAPPV